MTKTKGLTKKILAALLIGALASGSAVAVPNNAKAEIVEQSSELPRAAAPKGMPDYGIVTSYQKGLAMPYYPAEYGKYTGERLYFWPLDFMGHDWERDFGDKINLPDALGPVQAPADVDDVIYDMTDGLKGCRKTILGTNQSFPLGTNYDDKEGAGVTYTSSNTKVAYVKNGKLVTKKPGKATITAAVTGESYLSLVPADMQRFFSITLDVEVRKAGKPRVKGVVDKKKKK